MGSTSTQGSTAGITNRSEGKENTMAKSQIRSEECRAKPHSAPVSPPGKFENGGLVSDAMLLCGISEELYSALCSQEPINLASPKMESKASTISRASSPMEEVAQSRVTARSILSEKSLQTNQQQVHIGSSTSTLQVTNKTTPSPQNTTKICFADDGTKPLSASNQTPNSEFASIYPKFRLNTNAADIILSRVQTNVPAFFEAIPRSKTTHVCSEPDGASFKVRGESYLRTGLKVASEESMFALLGVDAFLTDRPITHCCSESHVSNFRSRLKRQCAANGIPQPFLLCVNLVVPWGNMISYYYRPFGEGEAFPKVGGNAADILWKKFLVEMNSTSRNHVFKLIPRVIDGPWMLKKMIGNKPAIIGDKLPVSYQGSLGEGYLEIVMDVAQGSAMANSICNACKGASDALSVDLAFVLEGKTEAELPERILAVFRLHHISMKQSLHWNKWHEKMQGSMIQ